VQKLSGAVFWQWVKSADLSADVELKKSERIDIIIEKAKKQIRIPEGMTLSTDLTHYRFLLTRNCGKTAILYKINGELV